MVETKRRQCFHLDTDGVMILLMERENTDRRAKGMENIHFHVGPVECQRPVRHLQKDAQQRAGI